jgi:hypothetical protein
LSHDGEIVDQYSLLQMIVDSIYQPLLFHTVVGFEVEKPILRTKDVLHPNSVQILFPGSPIHERLTKVQGPLALVSMKAVDSVALFSLQKREMVWNLTKNSHTQHDARLLPNGNLLLFDNWGNHDFQFSPEVRLIHDDFSSRVVELDPFSQEVVWKYGENENEQFFSQCCGRNQRLSNGNTLITHTKKGRAFEVTEEGEVVWEYVNPANSVRRPEKVASIYLQRLEREIHPFWKD